MQLFDGLSPPLRWTSRTSSLSQQGPIVLMVCGKPASPPSPSPSTGATGCWRLWSASPWHWSGESSLPSCPSCTSGPWCRASRATWSRSTASAACTPSVCTPSVTRCLRPWAGASAASESARPRRCSGRQTGGGKKNWGWGGGGSWS